MTNMNIEILDRVGSFGVILEEKRVIGDRVNITTNLDGTVMIGQKNYKTQDKQISFPEWELIPGPSKVQFIAQDGTVYLCGTLHRNGRFISVTNALDGIVTKLAVAYNDQGKELAELKQEIENIKKKYGIDIIGG